MNHCLLKLLLLLLIHLRHGIIAAGSDSDSLLIASVQLLILHLMSFGIVRAGFLRMLSGLLDLPLHLHLLLLRHTLLGREMLELVLVISGASLR